MRVNYNHHTEEIIVTLNSTEAERLTALLNRETHGTPDPQTDVSMRLEDALADLFI